MVYSNRFIPFLDFLLFPIVWGICFSLNVNPNGPHLRPQSDSSGTRLPRVSLKVRAGHLNEVIQACGNGE
jgi:hypothetical protein